MWKAASNEELREVARYLLQKRTEQIWFKILYISAGIGFAITIWCIKVVQRNHGHMFLTGLQKDELMVNGVFKYTRNPFYLTQVILYVPALLTFFSFWGSYFTIICTIGLSLYLFFIYLTIREEEKRLEAKYGQKYLDYKKATPRFWPRDWLGFLREARFPTKQKFEPTK